MRLSILGEAFCHTDVFIKMQFLIFLNGFLDDDLEGYGKMVSGRRKTGRVSPFASPCF